jgi:hypothetical protein
MQEPTMNGVLKPADAIARGPHVFDEATKKYKEVSGPWPHFPVIMFAADGTSCEALNENHQRTLVGEGWNLKPFPSKPAKETTVIPAPDLAMIILQQQETMKLMQDKLASLEAKQPTTAPAIPEHRGPGRPRVNKEEEVA